MLGDQEAEKHCQSLESKARTETDRTNKTNPKTKQEVIWRWMTTKDKKRNWKETRRTRKNQEETRGYNKNEPVNRKGKEKKIYRGRGGRVDRKKSSMETVKIKQEVQLIATQEIQGEKNAKTKKKPSENTKLNPDPNRQSFIFHHLSDTFIQSNYMSWTAVKKPWLMPFLNLFEWGKQETMGKTGGFIYLFIFYSFILEGIRHQVLHEGRQGCVVSVSFWFHLNESKWYHRWEESELKVLVVADSSTRCRVTEFRLTL